MGQSQDGVSRSSGDAESSRVVTDEASEAEAVEEVGEGLDAIDP